MEALFSPLILRLSEELVSIHNDRSNIYESFFVGCQAAGTYVTSFV